MLEADKVRAVALARAFGGRYVPACEGYSMTPYRAELWALLFEAGFMARKYGGGNSDYGWRAFRDGGRTMPMAVAIRTAREERVEASVAVVLED